MSEAEDGVAIGEGSDDDYLHDDYRHDDVEQEGTDPDKEPRWVQIQLATFSGWINSLLAKRDMAFEWDDINGVELLNVLEMLFNERMPKCDKSPHSVYARTGNVNLALSWMERKGIPHHGIVAEAIIGKNLKIVLGLLWTIINRIGIAQSLQKMKGVKKNDTKSVNTGVLSWVNQRTVKQVKNFKTDFADGRALVELVNNLAPGSVQSTEASSPEEKIKAAFQAAEEHLGVPQLFTAEDLIRGDADELSLITYLSYFFAMEGVATNRPSVPPDASASEYDSSQAVPAEPAVRHEPSLEAGEDTVDAGEPEEYEPPVVAPPRAPSPPFVIPAHVLPPPPLVPVPVQQTPPQITVPAPARAPSPRLRRQRTADESSDDDERPMSPPPQQPAAATFVPIDLGPPKKFEPGAPPPPMLKTSGDHAPKRDYAVAPLPRADRSFGPDGKEIFLGVKESTEKTPLLPTTKSMNGSFTDANAATASSEHVGVPKLIPDRASFVRRHAKLCCLLALLVLAAIIAVTVWYFIAREQEQPSPPPPPPTLAGALDLEMMVAHVTSLQNIASNFVGQPVSSSTTSNPGWGPNGSRSVLAGEAASLAFLSTLLASSSLNITTEQFTVSVPNVTAVPVLEYTADGGQSTPLTNRVDFLPFQFSPGIDTGVLPVTNARAGCSTDDFLGTSGIVLVERGVCPFDQKIDLAKAAGAVALLVVNNGSQPSMQGLFHGIDQYSGAWPAALPILGITYRAGAILRNGTVTAHLVLSVGTIQSSSTNLIATTVGGRPDRTIVVGATVDSFPASPGMNANGAGAVLLAQLALKFSELGLAHTNRIQFCLWGAGFVRQAGARHFLQGVSPNDVSVYIGLRSVASMNPITALEYQNGTDSGAAMKAAAVMESILNGYYTAASLPMTMYSIRRPSEASVFAGVGILASDITSGGANVMSSSQAELFGGTAGQLFDACQYASCDTVDNVNKVQLEKSARGAATLVQSLAQTEDLQALLRAL